MKISSSNWKKVKDSIGLAVFALAILITKKYLWLCLTDFNDPLSFCSYNNTRNELLLYLLLSLVTLLLMYRTTLLVNYISKWKSNSLMFIFVLFATLSTIWSVLPTATLYHALILLFTTVLAAYIGTRYSIKQLLVVLFWYSAITIIASYELLIIFPNAAIMAEPHLGSWRGIYWHKNFAGSLMALSNSLFLLYGLASSRSEKSRILVSTTVYLLSMVFIFFTKSAAGIVLWLVLNLLILILYAWKKIRNYLTKFHYYILGSIAVAVSLAVALNLNWLFRLLNREASFTGRMPLWKYLIAQWISKHPFIGYGHDAFWYIAEFKKQTTASQDWSFVINNGHNGFIDILLGLGTVGLLLALVVLLLTFYRTIKYYTFEDSVESMLPLVLTSYFFLANLSISFYLWFESFHWLLLIIALFATTPSTQFKTDEPNSYNTNGSVNSESINERFYPTRSP